MLVLNIPEYETIRLEIEDKTAFLIMDRPFVMNAFNADMVDDMLAALRLIRDLKDEIRIVVLTGEGKSFCTGADINWLQEIKNQTYEANIRESLHMSDLMYSLYSLAVPTVACVNGPVMGCAVGFVCACDIAIASDEAIFAINDVKLGVSPVVALPYIIRKIGESYSRELCLRGETVIAEKALRIGLVHKVVKHDELDKTIHDLCAQLLTSGPDAMRISKDACEKIPMMSISEARVYTAEIIAKQRISEEAQDGMAAFIKKTKPGWYPEK
jgi:methylglutaconyl-CoA hydratase